MKILYVGLLYNYGKSEEGFSYEHFNLEAGVKDCVDRGMFEADFLYPDESKDLTAAALEMVIDGGYDAIFHVAFNEHLDFPESAAKLALKKDIPVIQWDCDSSWRFQNWVIPRKDRVSHFVTTHSATLPWYQSQGMNAIKSQWAGSPLYHSKGLEKKYDVSFIGQKHGRMPDGRFLRAEIIDSIMADGIDITLFGNYWEGYSNWKGYITDFHDMIAAFDESRICLNLSNPWHHNTMPQIKGRHFEIPQNGGFQLCTPADDLSSYFKDGEEIVVVGSVPEMKEKMHYYLEHEEERNVIAANGRNRMLAEHQWHHRFADIFKQVGILC